MLLLLFVQWGTFKFKNLRLFVRILKNCFKVVSFEGKDAIAPHLFTTCYLHNLSKCLILSEPQFSQRYNKEEAFSSWWEVSMLTLETQEFSSLPYLFKLQKWFRKWFPPTMTSKDPLLAICLSPSLVMALTPGQPCLSASWPLAFWAGPGCSPLLWPRPTIVLERPQESIAIPLLNGMRW